jgi:hypothetical protein
VRRAVNAYPSLSGHLSSDLITILDSFHDHLSELAVADTKAMLDSMRNDTERAAWRKLGLREALRRRAAAWAPKRRSTSAFAVLDETGTAAAEHADAARLLQRHWQPTFSPPATHVQAQDDLLRYSATAPSEFIWDITSDDFDDALFHFHDSAPGPDGLPYSALARAHPDVIHHLRKGFFDFIHGGSLHNAFNNSNMVFIPKGELEADYAQVQRTPEATRPITLSNTIAKLYAKVLNNKLAALAKITVLPNQRGFVRGRRMQDNIIEAEALALHITKHFNIEAGMVLFDFSAAFPSVCHKFLFAALARLGVPAWFCTALRKLYRKCKAHILIGGSSEFVIKIQAGIRQGCPASGSIFALLLDPFVRCICLRLPRPLNSLGVFADDIVCTILHLFPCLRLLCPCFDLLSRAAGLKINAKKTVVIPLASTTTFAIRRFLVDNIPTWGNMEVNTAGKLLGVLIGPGADEQRWAAATAKFWTRARDARATTGGFTQALLHYRIFAVSVLQHLLSFSEAPKHTFHMENLATQGMTRGPFNTFPSGCLSYLTDIGYPHEAPSIGLTNIAALARTALTSDVFQVARGRHLSEDVHYSDDVPDEARLHPRDVDWFSGSVFAALLRAYDRVHQLPTAINGIPAAHLQAYLYATLRKKASPGPWPGLLLRRLHRWIPGCAAAETSIIMSNLLRMSAMMPHPMVFTYLRVFLNGVATPARMQGGSHPCLWCGWAAGDRVEHMIHCQSLTVFLQRHCPHLFVQPGPILRNRIFSLVTPLMSDMLLRDVCVFACILYHVYNSVRHGAKSTPIDLAEARLRQLRVRHAKLR